MIKSSSAAEAIQIDESTQKEREAYFNEHYSKIAHIHHQDKAMSSALGGSVSLSQAGAQAQLEEGDTHYTHAKFALATQCYLRTLRSPAHLCEGIFKIGLCLENGVDITQTDLSDSPIYERHRGHTLNHNNLAAVFFREVLALNPYFNDTQHHAYPLNPYFSEAIYHLGLCISKGAAFRAQDLINTALAGLKVETVDPKKVEIALYKRVMFLNPSHLEAQQRYEQSVAELEHNSFTEHLRPLLFRGTGESTVPKENTPDFNPSPVLSSEHSVTLKSNSRATSTGL